MGSLRPCKNDYVDTVNLVLYYHLRYQSPIPEGNFDLSQIPIE